MSHLTEPSQLSPISSDLSQAQGKAPTSTQNNTAVNADINDPKASAPTTGGNDGNALRDPEDEITPEQAKKEGLPEQKHAGAVGYGPNFASENRVTMGDKLTGLKEQVVGKVTKNPELAQQGRDRKTGELKKRERDQADVDPFATEDKKESPAPSASKGQSLDAGNNSSSAKPNGTTDGEAGVDGGRSRDVDLAPAQGRIPADSSHPAAQDEGLKRAAEL